MRDSGTGIPAEKHKLIFEKFQQADSTTARKYGGTGLGLSITKMLCELMGGDIELESEYGKGACFTIRLPLKIGAVRPVQQEQNSAQNAISPIRNTANILIVDDHPVNLLFMHKFFSALGFTAVEQAIDGRTAILLAQKQVFDVIMMDCQMPDIDGFEAAATIHRNYAQNGQPKPVIIAVTADAMAGTREKCMASGMQDYISKPVETAKLTQLLQKWIPAAEDSGSDRANKRHNAKMHIPAFAQPITNAQTQAQTQADIRHCLNPQRLFEFSEGDEDIERKISTVFLDTLEHDMQSLDHALAQENSSKWLEYVHKIYGSCANFGAELLADLCDSIQENPPARLEDMTQAHILIKSQFQAIISKMA